MSDSPTTIAEALPRPDMYYDPWCSGKCYYIRNQRENFIPITEGNLKRMLKAAGFNSEVGRNETVSELDRVLNDVQRSQDVDYAGPLAGYKTGIYEIENRKILVTEPPRFITPSAGDWDTLRKFIENLLEDQAIYLYGWLAISIKTLREGKRRPCQVLVVAGPANCGKSLLQNLITRLLGGRSAKPYQFMTGATQFNSELFHAEHLMIEDEAASFDLRVRRQLGRNLNAFVVNETQRCHPKNRQAITLKPFWRVSVTLNDEPENLMVLPPMEESLREKFHLLRARKCEMPMPTDTLEQWAGFMHTIERELPHFLDWLSRFEVPEEHVCQRFGMTHYHHPELLQMMSTLAPETKLLELIDTELFGAKDVIHSPWEGKSSDLEARLCSNDSRVAHEARKLMLYNSACGQYLGRLQKLHPDRISSRILRGYTIWEIEPPPTT